MALDVNLCAVHSRRGPDSIWFQSLWLVKSTIHVVLGRFGSKVILVPNYNDVLINANGIGLGICLLVFSSVSS